MGIQAGELAWNSVTGGLMSQVETTALQLNPKLLLKTLRAFRKGDFSARLPSDLTGIDGEIAEAFNDIADLNQGLARELERVAKVVGKEGRIERARAARRRDRAAGASASTPSMP